MPVKTYVLRSHTHSNAPVYQRINKDQRVRFEKRPIDHAYLQLTFAEAPNDEGATKNRTIRLKLSSNTIYQDEQIKEGILANVPFTTAERNAVKFVQGVLMTKNTIVQTFLEASPQFGQFKGYCDAVKEPLYDLYDKTAEVKINNAEVLKRLKAINKAAEIYESKDVKKGQDLMIRLNGSFYKAPDDIEEIFAGLTSFIDDADELMLDKLLDDSMTQDEQLVILVGKAVAAEIISFNEAPNQVSLKKNGNWVNVKMISDSLEPAERQRVFVEFLASPDGKYLADDLNKILGEEKKGKGKKETVNA